MSKILVIDDDGIVRDSLEVFLTRAGHEVITAADGANGLLAFKSAIPDLIILDRDMPVLTGSEVLAKIMETGRKPAVLVLTGFDNPDDAEEYLRAGATAFLSKGDGLSNVLSEVDRILGVPAKKEPASRYERKACAAPAAHKAGAPKILVADDDEAIRDVLSRFLAASGYAVFCAADGGEAIAAVEKEEPDIILLDIQMPVKNGTEVLKELRKKAPRVGVIMITGNDDEEIARQCLKNGAFDYLSKPVNLGALETVLKARLLEQR